MVRDLKGAIEREEGRRSTGDVRLVTQPFLSFIAGAAAGTALLLGWPLAVLAAALAATYVLVVRPGWRLRAQFVLSAAIAASVPAAAAGLSARPAEVSVLAWVPVAIAVAALLVALAPPSRVGDAELEAALDEPLGDVPADRELPNEVFGVVYGALKDEFERAIASVQTIGDRTAALPPLVIGLGALSLADIRVSGPLFLPSLALMIAAVTGAVVAAAFAFIGLRTRRFSFGPAPVMVYRAAVVTTAPHRRMLVRSMARITARALETTTRRAWFFNLALEAGTVSILSVFLLRLIGATGGD